MISLFRLFSDVFTITVLLAVAVSYGINYLNRRKFQRNRSPLYFSLFILSLCLFIFFDNSFMDYYYPEFQSLTVLIPVVYCCSYFMFLFGLLFISDEFQLSKKEKLPVTIVVVLLINSPILSGLTLIWGPDWFIRYLSTFVILYIITAAVFSLIYTGWHLVKKKKYLDIKILLSFLGITFIALYICFNRIILESHKELYNSNSFLVLSLFILIYVYILSRQSSEEFRELMELKNTIGTLLTMKHGTISEDELPFPASERELKIIGGLCGGKLYKEIASESDMSVANVKKIVHGIYIKAGVQNRYELINLLFPFR